MASRDNRSFIEVDSCQQAKHGQLVSGDVFLCQKIKEEDRAVAVLSDGLGSGIKASVLATLTATMALKYASSFMNIRRSAETIMNTLPICSVRKISYSTFTIVDIDGAGNTRIIEYDNPPFVLLRDGREQPVAKTPITLKSWQDRTLYYSRFQARLGDRIVVFSDGISQAGMGEHRTPLGWGRDSARDFAVRALGRDPGISARDLAHKLVVRGQQLDGGVARDDITCGVIYLRQPRKLLVATGPPYSTVRDVELARIVGTFNGHKAICGGTTANIISRVLGREVVMDLGEFDPEIPPSASMEGVDLITEGTLTLGRVATLLESGAEPAQLKPNAATRLLNLLLSSDVVHFVVGTRINQAHQDPNIPVELELRRNIIRRIAGVLEARYVRETHTKYL